MGKSSIYDRRMWTVSVVDRERQIQISVFKYAKEVLFIRKLYKIFEDFIIMDKTSGTYCLPEKY